MFPIFEYCHPDYDSSAAGEEEYTGGNDLCGSRTVVGNAVIGGENTLVTAKNSKTLTYC